MKTQALIDQAQLISDENDALDAMIESWEADEWARELYFEALEREEKLTNYEDRRGI